MKIFAITFAFLVSFCLAHQDNGLTLDGEKIPSGHRYGPCMRPWGVRVICEDMGDKVMSYEASVEYAATKNSTVPTY